MHYICPYLFPSQNTNFCTTAIAHEDIVSCPSDRISIVTLNTLPYINSRAFWHI
ncbi:hypothetical protein IQ230_02315 [Gloeocapsopsis crepidinum LEGE 06123]|uniref:Uncharacterized protein n=1 Tax=Gloeocapsopsis crepidinum LEGE 06123 TaxID=588587 RepID=A0ABR9ULT5_9CHRO|nr:hypothetical protein [Gloeocapsopsis crepidinum LEGE 06123]